MAEIPTTLPTFDELLALGIRADDALDGIRRSLHKDDLNVLTVHAEVEGGPYLDAFAALVDGLCPTTLFERLVDVARALDVARLLALRVAQATRPGRAGTVSCQTK